MKKKVNQKVNQKVNKKGKTKQKELIAKLEKQLEEEEGSVDPLKPGKGTPKLLDKKAIKRKIRRIRN